MSGKPPKFTKSHIVQDRIIQIDGKRNPEEVKELHLDGCKAENLANAIEILEKHRSLQELSLVNLGLSSVREFPKLNDLHKLDLGDNRLSGGFSHVVANCPNIEKLLLGGNRIKTFESIDPLKQLPRLKFLDLYDNDITKTENYREKVFEFLPQLTDLDGRDRDDKESRESEDEDDAGEEDYEDTDSEANEGETDENGDQVPDVDDEMNGDENSTDEDDDGDETSGEDEAAKEEPEISAQKGLKRKNEDTVNE